MKKYFLLLIIYSITTNLAPTPRTLTGSLSENPERAGLLQSSMPLGIAASNEMAHSLSLVPLEAKLREDNNLSESIASHSKDASNGMGSPARLLRLDDCLRIASENNRQVLIIDEASNQAAGKVTEARSKLYPSISTNLIDTRVDEVTSFLMPGIGKKTIGSLNSYKGEVSIRQLVYTGGLVSSAIKMAELGQLTQKTQKEDLLRNLTFQIKKAYYDVLLNEEIVRVNLKSEEVVSTHLEDVSLQNKEGLVANYDVLRAKVQLSNIRALRIQSQSTLERSKLILVNLMGLPLAEADTIRLTDKLSYNDMPSVPEDKWLSFDNRSDLCLARLKIKMQKQLLKMANAENLPSVSLVFNNGEEYPSRKEFGSQKWGDYWNISAMVSIPIFEGYRIKAKVRQETSVLRQAEIAELDLQERIKLELQQTILALKDSLELIASQKENIAQADEGLRLVKIGYKNGVNTQLEVLDAQVSLDTASKNYIQAVYLYNIAQATLESVIAR